MRESVIEKHLCDGVKALGSTAYKFKSPNRSNVPDRIIPWRGGVLDLVELKATGESPTDAQLREHDRWRRMGFSVFVFDSLEQVDEYLLQRD